MGVNRFTMLHLQDSLVVCMPFLILVPSVQRCQGGIAAAWHVRVKHPNVKNASCYLNVTPKFMSADVSVSSIFHSI